ncbi:MAG TPA: cytochrome c oxidase assembly protein [Propionicimonas sp.]|nr:cytochrome c oxidase assembly protein [Propionicimonas sp.]
MIPVPGAWVPLEVTPAPPDPHAGHGGGMAPMPGMSAGPVEAWSFQPDWLWLSVAAVLLVGYTVGRIALARRGIAWPAGRTIAWSFGVATLVASTCTGAAALGASMLSWHMVQHMTLSMLTPILLLLGRPVTLALRALPTTGRAGAARRGLLTLLRSRFARVVTHPGFTIPLFFVSLYGLYFSPALDALMASHAGHQFMLAHFLVTGTAFFLPLIAADPIPGLPSPGARLLLLAISVPLHAFFGVTVMSASAPISEHFAYATAALGTNPLADQHLAGGFAWTFGEIPTLAATLIIFTQWVRHDRRQAARLDRDADRTGDRELEAYNEALRTLRDRAGSE